jgi:hypothetical protein
MPILNIDHKDSIGNLTEKSTDKQIRANKKIREEYGDLLDMYPDYPVELVGGVDGRRVLRWKRNIIVDRLFTLNMVDLNRLWKTVNGNNKQEVDDMATFYRMMGYSLCGFIEVFGELLHLYKDEE